MVSTRSKATIFSINKATEQQCDKIPNDSFPIKKTNNTSQTKISNSIPQSYQRQLSSFDDYIKQQPPWIRDLIQQYYHNSKEESLLYYTNIKTLLLISTDESKGSRCSRRCWIIALHNGTHITSRYNPNFVQINQMNSYRAGIYAFLSASLFLYHCIKYFMIDIGN